MIRARYVDGPLAGAENQMHAPRVPVRLFYAPAPRPVPEGFQINGYMLVAYDQDPEVAWPGQVEYVLDPERCELVAGDLHAEQEQGLAVYRHADPNLDPWWARAGYAEDPHA